MPPVGRPRPVHWAGLAGLVAMWGSSYLAIEVALRTFSPLAITTGRVLLAAITLLAVMRLRGHRLPRDKASWAFFFLLSLLGNCLPFLLISWGQQSVASGLAGIAMAVVPLAVILLAHFFLPDEPLTAGRMAGFVAGFLGVALLIGPESLAAARGTGDSLVGLLAVLAGALCYASTAVLTRLGPAHHPLVTSASVMVAGSIMLLPLYGLLDPGLPKGISLPLESVLAVMVLGFLSTGLATVIFFFLVTEAGAGFQSMQSFLVPLWAVVMGAVVLGERLPSTAYVAMTVILVGLLVARRYDRTGRLPPR